MRPAILNYKLGPTDGIDRSYYVLFHTEEYLNTPDSGIQKIENGQIKAIFNKYHLTWDKVEPECSICFENKTQCIDSPCGHLVGCYECCSKMQKCVICFQNVGGYMQPDIFKP